MIDLNNKNRVFLVGYPCCGKSFYGRRIASLLKMNFVDSDVLVSNHESKSIVEIFNDNGETYFRNLERAVLLDYCDKYDNFVMATGGGLPCYNSNMEFINNVGVSFYLHASIDVLFGRIMKTKNIRPRFIGLTEAQMKEKIITDIQERNIFYHKANYIVDANCDVSRVIVDLLSSISFGKQNK